MFTGLKSFSIPEGVVVKITQSNGGLIWQRPNVVKLPEEYQEVEWLRANSGVGAYFDLGFSFDTKARIYMSQWIFSASHTTYPFGAAENSGTLRCLLSCPYSNGATFYGSNGTAYQSCAVGLLAADASVGYKHEFYMHIEKGNRFIDNLTAGTRSDVAKTQGVYTMTSNLYLFAQNYNGTVRYGNVRQIGYFKYYDKNDNLICDLVPCYAKGSNIPGMYDLVNETFLTNAGDGNFIIGPAVGETEGDAEIKFVDLISTAIGDDGKIYNGVGYRDGYRWSSSSGGETSYTNGRISGWLPYEYGATYRFENFYLQAGYVSGAYVIYKKTDGSILVQSTGYDIPVNNYILDIANDTCMFMATLNDVEYFRVSGYKGAEEPIIAKMKVGE